MQHAHIRNGLTVLCNSCPPRETAQPAQPDPVRQARQAYQEYRHRLAALSAEDFARYCLTYPAAMVRGDL